MVSQPSSSSSYLFPLMGSDGRPGGGTRQGAGVLPASPQRATTRRSLWAIRCVIRNAHNMSRLSSRLLLTSLFQSPLLVCLLLLFLYTGGTAQRTSTGPGATRGRRDEHFAVLQRGFARPPGRSDDGPHCVVVFCGRRRAAAHYRQVPFRIDDAVAASSLRARSEEKEKQG
jgi:hypothetical protein